MKNFRLILVYLAMSLAVLHSLVPHVHHDESNGPLHEDVSDLSLLERLSRVFHLDMGDDHLEEFQPGDGLESVDAPSMVGDHFWLHFTCPSSQAIISREFHQMPPYFEDPFPDLYLLAHHGRRGPPSFS